MNLKISLEKPSDQRDVEIITREAFYNQKDLEEKGFGCSEHYMVNQLRKIDGIKELNFVAKINEEIVGHIIYSKAYIEKPDNSKLDCLCFGPLTVKKKYQNQGIGTTLMKYSIEAAKQQGFGAILFYGHPNYYPRFGFVTADKFKITTHDGKNFDAFMAMELKLGYLKGVEGRLILSKVYDEEKHRDEIIAFENSFISRNT